MSTFSKAIDKIVGGDIYTFDQGVILRGHGKKDSDRIYICDLSQWSVFHEISFDVILLIFRNGEHRKWFDKYNDLLKLLRVHATDLEIPAK